MIKKKKRDVHGITITALSARKLSSVSLIHHISPLLFLCSFLYSSE